MLHSLFCPEHCLWRNVSVDAGGLGYGWYYGGAMLCACLAGWCLSELYLSVITY